jgi:hypothetical protein
MASYGPHGGDINPLPFDPELHALQHIVAPNFVPIDEGDSTIPLPDDRTLTLFEAAVLHKMGRNSVYVERTMPEDTIDTVRYRMRVVAHHAGGTLLDAMVVARQGTYSYTRLNGLLVAKRLGKEHAALISRFDGSVEGEVVPGDEKWNFKAQSVWQKLLPENWRTAGRLGMLFANGDPVSLAKGTEETS